MQQEPREFDDIYSAFQPKIYRYLVRLVGERDAEDLTQEVFVKVSRALESFRGESQLSTWLYRIATNAAYDRMRSPSFHRDADACPPTDALDDEEASCQAEDIWSGEKEPSIEHLVVRGEMNQCIANFIQALAENYRTVLVLSELEGLENHEIASILGVSLGTVKIRLHRAREKLRQALMNRCDPYWLEENEFVPDLKYAPEKV
jgi:RNA polymerase sigma-70 factor (ECF subfamily)